ncbi:metallopeptidase family protein [Candidatus Daviesbacteria bacterium]|nr:metallopeptidase family protein [Candidatus Daviesbacteria bacterium]
MENVDIVVEDWPGDEEVKGKGLLYGLYRGVPKTKRGNYYSGVLPDKITIFAGPILTTSKDLKEAREKIKDTVLHEIGHHFGLSDKQIYRAIKS